MTWNACSAKVARIISVGVLSLLLAACGGGGGVATLAPSPSPTPQASAGQASPTPVPTASVSSPTPVASSGQASPTPASSAALIAEGEKLARSAGCLSCHTTNGRPLTGPTWKGLYGKTVELANGQKVKADDNYIRQSILEPQSQVVKGYNPIMPSYQGRLSDDQIKAIIAYIKSLK